MMIMLSLEISKQIHRFTRRVIDGERDCVTKEFLESVCTLLHEAQVWPPTQEQICAELCAAYNYVVITVNSLLCPHHNASDTFDSSRTDRIIAVTLKRVYSCICNDTTTVTGEIDSQSNEAFHSHMINIISVLENPIFHFKSLNLLGRLLLFTTAVCLYKQQNDGDSKDVISYFVKLTEMAGVPVWKEKCYLHHGLLLSSSTPCDDDEGRQEGVEYKGLFIEDVMSLFLTTFQQPSPNLVMGHQPWKWLFVSMECRKLVKEKHFASALQKLHASVKDCQEPTNKCRLLCLFAECYFHMGCPQLAIQTYRDALRVDSSCVSVLYHLSLIYQSLNLPDQELESLNLFVMALAEDKKRKETIPVIDLDELIWSVHPPTPVVSFLGAKVTFAKRCLQLQRFHEAAEQYSSLIQMFQQEGDVLEFENRANIQQINIAEILVDAAEVLLITQQFQDCLKICDQTLPSLRADDSLAHNTQTLDNSSLGSFFLDKSQTDFFSDLAMSQTDDDEPIDLSSTPKKNTKATRKGESLVDLHVSLERSRKRLRSNNGERSGSHCSDDADSVEDILMTRLLLCKADALILSAGFTDQAVNCLQQALDILLCYPTPTVLKKVSFVDESGADTPHAKRQRINSDGKASGPPMSDGGHSNSPQSQRVWSKLLIDTALRMARASWERSRFPSVLNSCRLLEQIDKDNLNALYLKCQVLFKESTALQRETIGSWLSRRGVSYLVDKKILEETIKKIRHTIPQTSEDKVNWWSFSERNFLEFDVKSLECLLNIHMGK